MKQCYNLYSYLLNRSMIYINYYNFYIYYYLINNILFRISNINYFLYNISNYLNILSIFNDFMINNILSNICYININFNIRGNVEIKLANIY